MRTKRGVELEVGGEVFCFVFVSSSVPNLTVYVLYSTRPDGKVSIFVPFSDF